MVSIRGFVVLTIHSLLIYLPGELIAQQKDTTAGTNMRFMSGISGSVTGATNWRGAGFQSIAFNAYADGVYREDGAGWDAQHSFRWELGFTRFKDSLWMKHADLLRFHFLWSRDALSGRHSWMIMGRTQLFDSYFYYYDAYRDKTTREWAGTFLNPAELEAGYGFMKQFGRNGSINLSIATIRMRHEPAFDSRLSGNNIAVTRKGILEVEYGCSVQALFIRSFGKQFDWYFAGSGFVNGVGRDNLNMDLLNRFTLRIWRFFQLRLESRLVYEPLFSHKLQYRNELLCGVFADLKRP